MIIYTEVPVLTPAPEQAPQPSAAPSALDILSFFWFCGCVTALFYALIAYCALKHRVREAVRTDPGVREGICVPGAFLLGYFRPEIYLPAGLPPLDRQFIIAHERAHILRGDPWWKLLGYICCCMHWYNPLVWIGYALFCRDIEIACDEQVVRHMDAADRKAYSLALLNCGKTVSGLTAYPTAFGEGSLKYRIRHILTNHKSSLWITASTVVLAGLVAVCFLTDPNGTDSPPHIQPSPTETATTTVPTQTAVATEPTTLPTEPPEITAPPTEPPETTAPPTKPPETTAPPTEPPETTAPPTEPPETTAPPTEPPETTAPSIETPDAHQWEFVTQKAATADYDGYTLYKCAKCGQEKYEDRVSAKYETYDLQWVDTEATLYADNLGFQVAETGPATSGKHFSYHTYTIDEDNSDYYKHLRKKAIALIDDAYQYCIENGYAIEKSVIWVDITYDAYWLDHYVNVYCCATS